MKKRNVRSLGTWLLIVVGALLVLLIGVTFVEVAVFVARDFSLKRRAQLTIDAATQNKRGEEAIGATSQHSTNEITVVP